MQKKEIEKSKKEIEAKFLEITKAIGKRQQELAELSKENLRLEGEYRFLEKLEKEDNKPKEKK